MTETEKLLLGNYRRRPSELCSGVKVKSIHYSNYSVAIFYDDGSYTLFENYSDDMKESELTFGTLETFGLVSDDLLMKHYRELKDRSRQTTEKLRLEAAKTHFNSAVSTLGKEVARKMLDEI